MRERKLASNSGSYSNRFYSEIRTNPKYTLCGKNRGVLLVQAGGKLTYQHYRVLDVDALTGAISFKISLLQ